MHDASRGCWPARQSPRHAWLIRSGGIILARSRRWWPHVPLLTPFHGGVRYAVIIPLERGASFSALIISRLARMNGTGFRLLRVDPFCKKHPRSNRSQRETSLRSEENFSDCCWGWSSIACLLEWLDQSLVLVSGTSEERSRCLHARAIMPGPPPLWKGRRMQTTDPSFLIWQPQRSR